MWAAPFQSPYSKPQSGRLRSAGNTAVVVRMSASARRNGWRGAARSRLNSSRKSVSISPATPATDWTIRQATEVSRGDCGAAMPDGGGVRA